MKTDYWWNQRKIPNESSLKTIKTAAISKTFLACEGVGVISKELLSTFAFLQNFHLDISLLVSD